jgi:cyclopropane-fatty-acyl-phospholipid synthase
MPDNVRAAADLETGAEPSPAAQTMLPRRLLGRARARLSGADSPDLSRVKPGPPAGGPLSAQSAAAGIARRAVLALARRLDWGTLVLEDASGTIRVGSRDPKVCVRVHQLDAYVDLLRHGSVGLGRSYVDGRWDTDDLTGLVQILIHNRGTAGLARDRAGEAVAFITDPIRRLVRRSPATDRRHVRAHYDIGNELFSRMLDQTLSYSCGLFERPDMTLEEASIAKMDRICRKLGLSPQDHLLEIGTGWGGFAVHAATTYGCRVTTTTVSAEQYAHAREWVARAGLSERVTVLQEDYRNLRGRYDKLVSIEMVEAVDWRLLTTYFRACSRLLRPEGLMALQAITIDEQRYERAKNTEDFIKAFIFPGSCLHSIGSLSRAAGRTDLRIVDLEDIGRHYAETLRRWRQNLDEHAAELEGLGFDERFFRMWRLYLSYCEAAFLERHISDVQLVLAKPAWKAPLLVRS